MPFSLLKIAGSGIFSMPVFCDERGVFEASWEMPDLEKEGIHFHPVSACHSYNPKKGTLRGMHYQSSPHGQAKLVSCVAGSMYDVFVDLRPGSTTYLKWSATELSAGCGKSIYIPAGCAHGFITLTDDTTVAYLIEGDYMPQAAAVLRWNDPFVGIEWPSFTSLIMSDKDRNIPDFII